MKPEKCKYGVRPATLEDAEFLAPKLKQADLDEVWASHRKDGRTALLGGFSGNGKVWAGTRDEEVVLIFGVNCQSIISSVGVPWMLGSILDRGEGLALLRRSRHYVFQMRRGFALLENWTDARHKESHEWLRWCGFHLEPPEPWGAENLPFQRFWMPGYV